MKPEPVQYRKISLLIKSIDRTLSLGDDSERNASMLALLGIVVGLDILAKDFYFNEIYKTSKCGDKAAFVECAKQNGMNKVHFEKGLKKLLPLEEAQVSFLWSLRNSLVHAFSLPENKRFFRVCSG